MLPTFWKKSKKHLLCQWLAMVCFITMVLLALNMVSSSALLWAVGSSALASSAYLVFTMPCARASQPRRVAGSYLIAVGVGACFHLFLWHLYRWGIHHNLLSIHANLFWVSASLSVGVTIVLMLLLGAEHPPAVGLALVLVLNVHKIPPVLIIVAGAFVLAGVNYFFGKYLVNLVE